MKSDWARHGGRTTPAGEESRGTEGESSSAFVRTVPFVSRDGTIRLIVTLAGEFDFTNSGHIRKEMLAAIDQCPVAVVVDLSGVTSMDSTCLGVMVAAARLAKTSGVAFCLAAPSSTMTRLLKVTALNRILPTYADSPSALFDEHTNDAS